MQDTSPTVPATAGDRHRDRYGPVVRGGAAIIVGILAGVLLVSSFEAGVGLALEGASRPDWDLLQWGRHWVWRTVASAVATALAGFLAGMVARHRGALHAAISAGPAALYWAAVAWIGWSGHVPFSTLDAEIPLGYRIVAVLLAFGTIPLAGVAGSSGAPYGRANAQHLDSRRGTLLGIRWYHYLWLPILLHFMVLSASYGAVYGFGWIVTAWKGAMSFWVIIPTLFAMALFWTLQLLGLGALGTYEALAGFEDGTARPVWRRVFWFGFGYTLLAILAQFAISMLHSGLSALGRKFLG